MSDRLDFNVEQPVSFWFKDLDVDFKSLFVELGKTALAYVSGNSENVGQGILGSLSSFNFKENCAQTAWVLIVTACEKSMQELMNEHTALFKQSSIDEINLASSIEKIFEEKTFTLPYNFLEEPKSISILTDIQKAFQLFLIKTLKDENKARQIASRLPTYYVYNLIDSWRSAPEDFLCLKEQLDNPFAKAGEKELEWTRYRAYLQKFPQERVFEETFAIEEIFIKPRAYYKEIIDDKSSHRKEKRHVDWLENFLNSWITTTDKNNTLKVISGGPGSGKSTFAKLFASDLSSNYKVYPLFIPLHLFDLDGDLSDSIGKFFKDQRNFKHNPFNVELKNDEKLVLIFDGLDELSLTGQNAYESVKTFLDKLERKLANLNQNKTNYLALISGRPIAVGQQKSAYFDKKGQILQLISYLYLGDKKTFIDFKQLLEIDQRDEWWKKFGALKDKYYQSMPQELNKDNLQEITSEPLLNYLVSLSYEADNISFDENTNLNEIYGDLICSVFNRKEWAGHAYCHTKGMEYEEFHMILEEISLSAWHGNGRTTTINDIEEHCKQSNLTDIFHDFKVGVKEGIGKLLLSFFFKAAGTTQRGDDTFQFTHKSFGEYLITKRIFKLVKSCYRNIKERERTKIEGWSEVEALEKWLTICGFSSLTQDIFEFIKNEIILEGKKDREEVLKWQKMFAKLLTHCIYESLPAEKLGKSFKEQISFAKNTQEALLVLHSACSEFTGEVSIILREGEDPTKFGTWLYALQGQMNANTPLVLNCLNHLELSNTILDFHEFYQANLSYTILNNAKLNFWGAFQINLEGANLERAILWKANLEGAHLIKANLEGARLVGANLEGANLEGANLEEANLQSARLVEVNLEGANLKGANLKGANLKGARLKEQE